MAAYIASIAWRTVEQDIHGGGYNDRTMAASISSGSVQVVLTGLEIRWR